MIYIAGLEVAVNNTNDDLVHMLAYPDYNSPMSLPFIGDGDGEYIDISIYKIPELTVSNIEWVDEEDNPLSRSREGLRSLRPAGDRRGARRADGRAAGRRGRGRRDPV